MKRYLRKVRILKKVYRVADEKVNNFLFDISPTLLSKKLYKKVFNKKLNLVNPVGFNEKLQWLKLNKQTDLIIKCADKYEMREYVKSCGCEEILNDIYGVYDDINNVNFDEFPEKFAIKCTHGCGYNIICKDKNAFDIELSKIKLQGWMNEKFGVKNAETHYLHMKPRIICEKFLDSEGEYGLIDYKIYCFNGEPLYTLVCCDREGDIKKQFYDINWKKTNFRKDSCDITIECPQSYDEMIMYAKILSREFEFVRVDFYEVKLKPILGELTFTPAACLSPEYTDEAEEFLGSLIKLPI